jgi:hypothetical protein
MFRNVNEHDGYFGAVNEALLGCSQFHFKIISISGDGAQCNRQFHKRFFNESLMDNNGRKHEGLMVDRIPHQPIFYISGISIKLVQWEQKHI